MEHAATLGKPKVFLTGGTGFIGRPLARALIGRGWELVALVRRPESPHARALAQLGARCVPGDVTERESLRAGMAGADIVIHNAAWYEVGIPRRARPRMRAINVGGTANTLGVAEELGVARVVYVSSVAAYGDSGPTLRDEGFVRDRPCHSFYEQTKTEAHALALGYQRGGLPLTIVCPAQVMGPNDHSLFGHLLRLYLSGLLTPFGYAPEMLFSPAHVDDVAEGVALAAERGRPGATYILAGDTLRLRDMFAIWGGYPGGMKIGFYIPRWLAEPIFAPLGPLLRALGVSPFLSHETISASRMSYAFSSARAQRELGWRYRPAGQMWREIIAEERRLLAARPRRDLIARLRPVE